MGILLLRAFRVTFCAVIFAQERQKTLWDCGYLLERNLRRVLW